MYTTGRTVATVSVAVGNALGRFLPVRHHRCLTACWRAGWLRGRRAARTREVKLDCDSSRDVSSGTKCLLHGP